MEWKFCFIRLNIQALIGRWWGCCLSHYLFPSHSSALFLQKLGTLSLFRCSYIIYILITTDLFVVSLMMYSSAIYCCFQNFPNTTLKLITILLDLYAWFVLLVVSWYLIFNGFFWIRQIGPNFEKNGSMQVFVNITVAYFVNAIYRKYEPCNDINYNSYSKSLITVWECGSWQFASTKSISFTHPISSTLRNTFIMAI